MPKGKHVQSVIFAKSDWTLKKAHKWLDGHGYTKDFKGKGVDETSQSYRFRQMKPLTKSQKNKGYRYITTHPEDSPGVAMVEIVEPDKPLEEHQNYEKKHKEEKVMKFRVRKYDSPEDDFLSRTYTVYNLPLEYRSAKTRVIMGEPVSSMHPIHHPTAESLREMSRFLDFVGL